MKKCLLYLFLLGFGVTVFSACKKNTDTLVTISYKVGGVQKGGLVDQAEQDTSYNNQLVIDGPQGATEGVYLQIDSVKTGTFVVGKNYMLLVYTASQNAGDVYFATSGQVTITSLTKNLVSGTFQFTATNAPFTPVATKVITEGSFNCAIVRK